MNNAANGEMPRGGGANGSGLRAFTYGQHQFDQSRTQVRGVAQSSVTKTGQDGSGDMFVVSSGAHAPPCPNYIDSASVTRTQSPMNSSG